MPGTGLYRLAAGALLVGLMAGCTSGSDSSDGGHAVPAPDPQATEAAAARGVELAAELDPETGAVVLPFDRFVPTTNDMITIGSATSRLVADCAADSGVTFTPAAAPTQPEYDSELYFGPWTTAQAERFAFVSPMSAADLAANGIKLEGVGPTQQTTQSPADSTTAANNALSDDDWDVVDACGSSDEVHELNAGLAIGDGPWAESLQAISDGLADQPEVQSAIEELGSCFTSAGLSPDPTAPWLPVGYDTGVISEQQVALALSVVACKDQTDFTARVAEVQAEEQAPVVVTYLDELLAKRSALDEALETADEVLDQQ